MAPNDKCLRHHYTTILYVQHYSRHRSTFPISALSCVPDKGIAIATPTTFNNQSSKNLETLVLVKLSVASFSEYLSYL